jgi:phage repressor protein C with HTH and peptisase S24 domain
MSACSANECADECFALQVLGMSMEPEFMHGEIVIVEPEGLVKDGCYVVAQHRQEWIFRQLFVNTQGGWTLHALNPNFGDLHIQALSAIVGVIIQKSTPGQRSASKSYR